MTAPTGEVSRVTGTWLTLERSLAREPEGIMATVTITSTAPTPVAVQVVEALPASWDVTEIGVHPRHEPREFTAEPSQIVFADVVDPEDGLTVVYGVRVVDAKQVEPPAPPAIEEALLEARESIPFGLTADGGLAAGRAPPADADDGWNDAGWLEAGAEETDASQTAEPGAADGDEPRESEAATWGDDAGPDIGHVDQLQFEFVGDATDDEDPSPDDAKGFDAIPEAEPAQVGSSPADPIWSDDEPAVEPGVDEPADDPPADEPIADTTGTDLAAGATSSDPPPEARPAPSSRAPDDLDSVFEGVDANAAVPDAVAEATNLLVLADHADTATGCTRLLNRQVTPGDGLVLVSFLESVDDRLEALSGLTAAPREVDLVCMGEQVRSSTADRSTLSTPIGEVTVTSVADATDLVRLGVHVGRALDDAGERPVLCLHSLSALVGLVDLQRVFRFVHVLSGRVTAVDGRAHYHLDPSTVDERAFATLRQLFEVVVRYEDGQFVLE